MVETFEGLRAKDKQLGKLAIASDQLRGRFTDVARRYRGEHTWANQPTAASFRSYLQRVATAAHTLTRYLEDPPPWWTWYDIEHYPPTSPWKTEEAPWEPKISDLIGTLKSLAIACEKKSKTFRGSRGARTKSHVQLLVEDLAELWSELHSKRFPKNVEVASGTFISPASHFVHQLARAVDSEISFSAIRTALKGRASGNLVSEKPSDETPNSG
jgi:hypothetical protein